MKSIKLLVWLTQLGLSISLPPLGFIWLAVWLRDKHGWGNWVLWAGIILGIFCAIDGLRVSFNAMNRMAKDAEEEKPPTSFNNHV